jgi:hypothetical protein
MGIPLPATVSQPSSQHLCSLLSCQCFHAIAPGRAATPNLAFATFSFEVNVNVCSKISQTGFHLGRDDPKRCNQRKIVPFIQTSLTSKRSHKAEGYPAVCVQYVAVSCCLSARQMATSKPCKVPTKEVQRLDHATKLGASLPRQLRCHCIGDRGEPALGTAPALLLDSLHRLLQCHCSRA